LRAPAPATVRIIPHTRLRPSRARRKRGFGIIELLVVIGIIALAIAMLMPSLCRSRETANRVKCASNLRSVGQAMLLYANDNKGAYPRATFVEGALPTWGTAAPAPNDVSAALFILLRTQDITPEVFVCPSSNAEKWDFGGGSNTAMNWSNWTDVNRNLSYSYHNPYSKYHQPGGPPEPEMLAVEFAVAADINPGVGGNYSDVTAVTTTSSARDMKRANSKNHDEDGQNVLYGDGHVSFEQNPFAGVDRDNIYTAKSGTVIAAPADVSDSILLPAAQ
jgi:prepilin-type N-terminal cleavage/methylation domain-containing protein/prepilin-type processing-associated H-X9-DG protein